MSKFKARLRGANEVPPVSTNAFGTALFKFKQWRSTSILKFVVQVRNISNITRIDLHLGERGEVGPVVARLVNPARPTNRHKFKGVITRSDLRGPLAGLPLRFLIREIKQNNVYVNVHTVAHPRGEIRGQIREIHHHHHHGGEM